MDDKRELLKLKQGLITVEESPLELKKTNIIKPTGTAAVSNFIYHHKLHLSIAAFFTVVAVILAYFTLTAEKADITILLIADSEEVSVFFRMEAVVLEEVIEFHTPDFNGNGKIHAECLFIDLVTNIGGIDRNSESVVGDRVKLFGEVQGGNALIYIGNRQALESIPGTEMTVEDFYVNLEEHFPNHFDGVDGIFFKVKGSYLDIMADYEFVPLPDDLYIVLRNKPGDAKEKALEVLRSIILAL